MDNTRLKNLLGQCFIEEDEILSVVKKQTLNAVISSYLKKLASEFKKSTIIKAANGKRVNSVCPHVPKASAEGLTELSARVESCCDFWNWDIFHKHKVMDLLSVNYCHSRYCPNCQKLIQATRLMKFFPVVSELETDPTVQLYHLTLTVPNVKGKALYNTITCMFYGFTRLVQYLKGQVKIKGFPLAEWGYRAAVRSLEVTYKNHKDDFHPHLHCVVALRSGLDQTRKHENVYSYDASGKKPFRLFTDNELFIQKLWRLVYDRAVVKFNRQNVREREELEAKERFFELIPTMGRTPSPEKGFERSAVPEKQRQKVRMCKITKAQIDAMSENDGYSCTLEPVSDENYKQVFKYAMKISSEESELMKYRVFKVLFDALHGRRTIAGYGEWYNIAVDDSIDNSVDNAYKELEDFLRQEFDKHEIGIFSPIESLLYAKANEYVMISRKSLHRYVRELSKDEHDAFIEEFNPYKSDTDLLGEIPPERQEFWREVFANIAERKKVHDHLIYVDHIYEEYIYPLEREAERREKELERIAAEKALQPTQISVFCEEKISHKKRYKKP